MRELCLIADPSVLGQGLLAALAAVLEALPGRVMVIDRWPHGASDRRRLAHLHELAGLCRDAAAPLMVSARADLALAIGALGVHLPERGLAPRTVRASWPELVLGRSCHDRAGLVAAAAAGAEYALLSPVAAPTSKPVGNKPMGIDGFAAALGGLRLPVLALGGVTATLAPQLRRAGAAGLASLGGVLGAVDPAIAARELIGAWDAGRVDKQRTSSDKQPN